MFIFYDTETTGISTTFDQILQFAAIVTDKNLQEIDGGSLNIRCKLLPYIVPSPTALSITNVNPDLLINQSLNHREFMNTIAEWSKQWGHANFIGYNNIKFDENMLRQGFYQTLNAPYLTNTNGNTRSDVMRLAHATFLFNPNALKIPLNSKNRPVFKLGVFAKENGIIFDEGEAHDALYDVRKTIELANLIKNKAPNIWKGMIHNSSKSKTIEFINNQEIFAAGEIFFGNPYRSLMTYCGTNFENPSQKAVFDLSFSPEEYMDLSIEELIQIIGKNSKVIHSVATNAQPFIININQVSEDYWGCISVTQGEAIERAKHIRSNVDFQNRIGKALANRFEAKDESPNLEDNIYRGFASNIDANLMVKFHDSNPEQQVEIMRRFKDDRYKEIAKRLIYSETPEVLPDGIRKKMDSWRASRLCTVDDVPWRTLSKAILELENIKKEKGENDPLLKQVEVFFNQLADELAT